MNVEQATGPQRPLNPAEEATEAAPNSADLQRADEFLRDVAPHLGRLFGMDLRINIGPGWATNLKTGDVTADPKFFLERGYTPDMSVYATLHEVCAHLREVVTKPKLTEEVVRFTEQGRAQAIFQNVLSDIAGNNLIHAVLPRTMPKVAEELYREKLFPEADYSKIPRHLQFLYKIMRQEMIPDSETAVRPEVDEAIQGLRDYQNKGDLIKYSTSLTKSNKEAMSPEERFRVWTKLIYPVYEKLIEQDKEDPVPNQQGGESDQQDQSQGDPQQSDGQEGEQSGEQDESQTQGGGESGEDQFETYYDDYNENRHPEPMSEEEHEKIHEYAKEKAQEESSAQRTRPQDKTERERIREATEAIDSQVRQESGHTLAEQRRYNNEIIKWQDAIAEMRDVYKKVIQERLAQKRGLSRRTFDEGAILDPNRLAQTVIDINAGIEQPEAFRDYEEIKGNSKAIGKTDYVFVFDVSGSMAQNGKAEAASASAVIGLEGLSAMQRDVEEAELENNMDLELDIRTAIYTLGERPRCLKPLSTSLGQKERLDTYSVLQNPNEGNTLDYLTLEEVEKLKAESDRRQIVIVVSDGEGENPARAKQSIDRLRAQDWLVYGISIGSNEAEVLYAPTAKRVDDPAKLPEEIYKFIEATVS